MLKIGSLHLKTNLILAPMAGISDYPFRMLNRRFGCELAFVEMINCRSISYKSKRTQMMLTSAKEDCPLGIQILGCEPQYILKSLDVLKKYHFDILDFNAACPAKKVVRRGEGAALMKDPEKFSTLLALIAKNTKKPVTVKIRAGWDKHTVNAQEIAQRAEDAGVDALFIHGRTRQQGYSGTVDYAVIAKVKKAVGIPVIASGDILSAQLAQKMLDETGCDGLAIARGALGHPWIFREIKEFSAQKRPPERVALDEVKRVMREHLEANIAFYGERNGVVIFRKFFNWYTRGLPRIRQLKERSSRIKTQSEMNQIIQSCCSPVKQKTPSDVAVRGSL